MRKSLDDLSEITRSQLIKYQITPLARSLTSQREGHKTFRICKREFLIEVASLLDFPSLSDQSLRQVIFCGTLHTILLPLSSFSPACLLLVWRLVGKQKKGRRNLSFSSPFFPPPWCVGTCLHHHQTELKKNCHHVSLVNVPYLRTVDGRINLVLSKTLMEP